MVVHHLQGQGYAVSIEQDLKARFGKSTSLGAIYTTLDRLEKKGLVSSRLGEPTKERGGKPKRFYRISASGQFALRNVRDAGERLWAGAPPLGVPT